MKTAPNKKKPMFSSMRKMDDGGTTPNPWQSANQWATKNQKGISAAADYGAATVDAFAPTDNYGVRSNGAAIGSGLLSGAGKGAAVGSMFGPEGTIIGAGAGAVIGGVEGLLGNEKANKLKIQTIQKNTTNQLNADQQAANARIAGDPSLKYGRMSASYYRFGGVMKNTPASLPRTTKPLPAVQAKPRLMPNITESPNRQMSRMANGGYGALPNAIHNNAAKLFKPTKTMKAQKNQILADGGPIEQMSSQDIKVNGPSHENGGVKFPSAGVELEGGETVNNGFVFSKKLGFAKPAEAVAKQLGKAEKRPETAINTATVNALQRKTELLKVHQEAAKQAAGIPSDLPKMAMGGPGGPDSNAMVRPVLMNPNLPGGPGPKNPFLVEKRDGSIGQWGNALTDKPAAVPVAKTPVLPAVYNPATFQAIQQPGRTTRITPTPAAIPRTSYKFGGSMKKMADGGDPNPWATNPITGLINKTKLPGVLDTVNITAPKAVQPDYPNQDGTGPDLTGNVWTPDKPAAPTTGSKFNKIGESLSPFLSNYVNATQRLPLPPVPQLNTEITPSLVDYSASRNEAVRSARSADASARTNLNSGAAITATKAANLAGQVRSISQINEAENNQNAQIRNSTAAENAQIRAGNTALQNNYNNSLVERQIKAQNLKSANMANLEEKVQGMSRDKKLFDQEGEKAILGFLQNNDSGAGYDAARPILAKHLSEDQLKQMDTWAGKMRADRASERADNMKANKLQLDYLKNKNGTTSGILNGASAISPGKMKRTGTETDTDKEGNKTIKKSTSLYN